MFIKLTGHVSNIESGTGVKETPEQIMEMIKNETKELPRS